ncbi:MAG TPA: hypothetical protein VG798_02920 [Rhizomicrobium sp.]|nr:hypothetical protein [Rhizomicrobium sp.]
MPAGEISTIALQVQKVGQLFDTLDPLPFRERDLDREAEEYIVSWARELPHRDLLRIVVHLPPAEAQSEQARILGQAMRRYFHYRAEITDGEVKELFRRGRFSLAIGLAVLAACLAATRFLGAMLQPGQLHAFLNESLIIFGWVANWRPIEIFLYDWWPLVRRHRLFQRLAGAEVVVQPSDQVPKADSP